MRPIWTPNLASAGGWQAGPVQDAATLASLQTDLERARGEYALQRPDSALQILGELLPSLRRSLQRATRTDLSQQALLLASARCLEGRVLGRRGQQAPAAEAFGESVSLFETYRREMESQNNVRAWTDYGIALFRVGRPQEAIAILEKVCASGAAPAEAFGYLGVVNRELGNFPGAEEALRKGLQLAPGDQVLSGVLAQTLDQAGKFGDAVAAYCDAALAAGQAGDLEAAHRLLSRALEIAPTDPQPVAMMTAVLRAQHDEPGAMDLLDRTLKLDSSHRWALGLKALLLRERGDLDGAIRFFRQVDVQSPDLSWVLLELAKALHQADAAHDPEALRLLEQAAQLNPEDPDALLAEAEILQATDVSKAVAVLRRAVDIEPQAPALHAALAEVLVQAKDYPGASAAWDEVLRLDPKSTAALVAKARVLQHLQQPEEAIGMLRRAARIQPGDAEILGLLVDVLVQCGRGEEALDELAREIQRDPNCWAAHWKLGNLLVSRKRFEEAQAALEKAAALQPDNASVQADLGEALRQAGRYEEAGAAFDRALELDHNSADALGLKAYCLCECAAFPEAAELLERALGLADLAWLHSLLGWACEHLGPAHFAKAEAAFRRAIELDPESPWHRKHLANVLYDSGPGRREEAIATFKALIGDQTYRPDASLLALLGWCHYRLQRYDEALRLLQSCVSLDPDDTSTHFDIALVLLASGRGGPAVAEYQLSVERTQEKQKLRQRGLFYVALYDLVTAAADGRIRSDGGVVFKTLRDHLAESGVDTAKLAWLADGLADAALAG